jgi:GNAT superfamily N-acetyltransferase
MITVGVIDAALTRELRRSVLRPELPAGAALPGDDLPAAVHLAAVARAGNDSDDRGDGDPVTALCTCFVYPDPCPWLPDRPAWHLRQMATLPQRRGEGLGGAVLEAAIAYVRHAGAELIWCNGRERAVPFYARHGFSPHGDVFTDERHTIAHQQLWRELSAAPTSSER